MSGINTALFSVLKRELETKTLHISPVGGGSINDTFQLLTDNQKLFCKLNSATKFPHLFQKEAAGLLLLEKTEIIRTPKVIKLLEIDTHQVLILEWIERVLPTNTFWKLLGEKLAHLHQVTYHSFGFETDNYIGAVRQLNTVTKNWTEFFVNYRLQPLVQKCVEQNLLSAQQLIAFTTLYSKVATIFNEEPPSLLHGDLWSGNFICTTNQEPVLIDPAVYFGHRSMDLGMTTLFSGFAPLFYEAYHYHYPLPQNRKEQWQLANLYPLLIHLLLFGKTYLPSIEHTLNDFQ